MTKAERLARRMHELGNEFFDAHKEEFAPSKSWEKTPQYRREAMLYVARALLRDQAKERRGK